MTILCKSDSESQSEWSNRTGIEVGHGRLKKENFNHHYVLRIMLSTWRQLIKLVHVTFRYSFTQKQAATIFELLFRYERYVVDIYCLIGPHATPDTSGLWLSGARLARPILPGKSGQHCSPSNRFQSTSA